MTTNIYTVYAETHDITFIMEDTFTNDGEPVSTEVKGFYYGEPCDDDTQTFYGDLIAHF